MFVLITTNYHIKLKILINIIPKKGGKNNLIISSLGKKLW